MIQLPKARLVQLRVPEPLLDAIEASASKHFQSKSEYMRQSVISRLKEDGVKFEEVQPA
jgi:hypothetical protein